MRRTLARTLRRWADWVMTEERTPLKPTLDNIPEGAARQPRSADAATLADDPSPDSGEASGEAARRMPGEPPRHWLDLMRRAAPDLIQPAQERMVTYRSVPASPPVIGPDTNRGDSAAVSEGPASAAAGRPLPEGRPSLPDATKRPLPAVSQHAPGPAVQAPGATNDHGWSRHPSQPDSYGSQPTTRSKDAGEVASLSHETGWGNRPIDNASAPSLEATGATSLQEQSASFARHDLLQVNSREVTRAEPRSLLQLPEEPQVMVREPQDPIGAPSGRVYGPRATAPTCVVAPFFPTMLESSETRDFAQTVASSAPWPGDESGRQTEGSGVRRARYDLPVSRIPERTVEPWPELPVSSSRVPARAPLTVLPNEMGPQTATLEPSSTGWPARAESRWPELLEEPPSVVGEWEEALRSRERTGRLDREQQGGE